MNRWRLLGLRAHWFAGLVAGLILAVMGVTGATMALENELIEWLNPALRSAQAPSAGSAKSDVSYAKLLPLLQQQLAGKKITLVQANQYAAVVVGVNAKGQTDRLIADAKTGRIVGAVRGAEFFNLVRRLHRWLALPGQANGPGRMVIGACAMILILLALSGIWLGWKRSRPIPPVNGIAGWGDRRRYSNWHIRYGIWLAPFFLWSALSGLWWSFDWYRTGVIYLLGGTETVTAADNRLKDDIASARKSSEPASPAQLGAAIDRVVAAMDGPGQRLLITLPRKSGQLLRLRRLAIDATHDRAYDDYRVDPGNGQILSGQRYESLPLTNRLNYTMEPLHTGSYFGLPARLLLLISSLTLPVFAVTGLVMYILRRCRESSRNAG